MFSRISTIAFYGLFAFTALTAASPGVAKRNYPATTTITVTAPASTNTIPASSCSTGPIQCCASTQSFNDLNELEQAGLAFLYGINIAVASDLDILLGLVCTDIVGTTCSAQAVCCENNSINSVVSIGCIPVSL
ncbi:hypothetical protein BDP27DRAFT_1429227 [Rhodocollybia butyracea]|uniref:Hydrophobin n=1 Tax=Rhodocollybia butyracea TaxID=206335 RepID=A0A9P5U139_9AGAR|nr:hypothetical protein BDP27DRAFT_1429227 [Rhodocollybia butyracea]